MVKHHFRQHAHSKVKKKRCARRGARRVQVGSYTMWYHRWRILRSSVGVRAVRWRWLGPAELKSTHTYTFSLPPPSQVTLQKPVFIPAYAVFSILSLLSFPLMWNQIAVRTRKLADAVRFPSRIQLTLHVLHPSSTTLTVVHVCVGVCESSAAFDRHQ